MTQWFTDFEHGALWSWWTHEGWDLLCFSIFSRKATIHKTRYVVQWHIDMLHWCLEQLQLAKNHREVGIQSQSGYPGATSAIGWTGLTLGFAVAGNGTASAGLGLRCPQALEFCSYTRSQHKVQVASASTAMPRWLWLVYVIAPLEMWGTLRESRSSCTDLLFWCAFGKTVTDLPLTFLFLHFDTSSI